MKKRILSLFVTLLACIMSANATLSTTDYANNDYVGEWGRLKLVGNQLCAENGDTIQLRGVSTFSVQYHEVLPCLTLDGFKALKKWGCSVVRLSQYPVSEVGRYDSTSLKRIQTLIDYCADLNMYVIADWNVFEISLMDGNPLKLQKEAITFFTDITSYVKEKGYKHVLYEICGEPTIEWYGILNYSRAILPIIEANDPGAIVIVGTPDKSRDLTDVLDDPIEGYDLGIMYAYHHSACDGGSYLPGVKKAAEELPLIVSEWWVTDYEGSNGGCFDKSDEFIDFLADSTAQKISWIYWAFGQKNEASNMMKQCIFDENDTYVSNSGKYIIPKFGFMQKPVAKPYEYHPENYTLSSTDYANNNYFGKWGRLKLVGNQLCAESGDTIQLRGVSTFSVQYHEVLPCLTLDGFKALKKWGCSVVRLSQYPVSEVGRYDSISLKRIQQLIDYCADLNMYVIADWNVFDVFPMDGNPLKLQKEAITFFTDITSYVKEKGYKHVLYEICGEPTIEWYGILNYSRAILPIIEANDPGAIVIVGTPDKSRDLTDVLDEPIEGYDLGIMYAYHHSACDGGSYLPGVKKAAEELPLIVSEWWVTDYEGSNGGCFDKSDEFIDFLADSTAQKISWIYWAFGQKNEASNMMKQCIFDENDTYVSNSGKYIIPKFGFMQIPTVPVVAPVAPQVDCDVVFPHLVHQLEAYKCDASLSEVLLHTNYVPVNSVTGEVAVLDSARAEGYEMEDPFFVGDNIVKWTFTFPSSGLSTTCEQVITVKDVTPPSFDCDVINNVRIVAEEGDKLVSAAKLNFTMLKPVDPCGEVAVTAIRSDEKNIIDPYPIGKTIIEYRFTDVHGNVTSCLQDVEVVAHYKVVDCDKNFPSVVVNNTDSCSVNIGSLPIDLNVTFVDSLANDISVTTVTRASGASIDNLFMVGTDTLVWNFKFPKAGREETCEQVVVVEDVTPPTFDCSLLPSIRVVAEEGELFVTAAQLDLALPFVQDNCGEVAVSASRSDEKSFVDPYPVGKTIIEYRFADVHGNVLSCQQDVEVVAIYRVVDCDKSYPIARLKTDSCKVDFNSIERAMTPPVDLYFDDVAVVDTFRVSGASFDEPFMVGTDTVVWKFKFPKTGKEETCEQMVVVEDATPLNEFIDCEQFADVKIKLMQGGSALYDTPLNISSCAEHPCTGALICPEISRSDSMPMNAPVPVGKTILHYKFTSKTGEVLVCNQVLEVEVEDPLNTEGVDADNVVAVVPNPTNGQFSVVVAEPSTISIYNAVGVKVFESKADTTITITNKFEPGIYSVVVEGANSVKTVKLIVSVN